MKNLILGILLMFAISVEGQTGSILSADSLYNLGNTAFNQEKFDQAIYFYEKARLLDPTGKDLIVNIQLANEKLSTDIIEFEPFFLATWWNTLANLMLPGGWKVISIIILFCFLLLVYLHYFKGKVKNKNLFFTLIGIGCLLFFTSVFAGKTRVNQIYNSPFAIVFGGNQSLLEGPDPVSKEAKRITGGNKLRILDEYQGWYKVSTMDSEQGWIKKENVKLIKY